MNYGKGLGAVNTATGVSLLPATGDNSLLFVMAATLVVSGVVVFVAATVLARKNSQQS